MNKFLTGLLITGAVVAVGVIISKLLKKKSPDLDFDDEESYDYDDESIEFEFDNTDSSYESDEYENNEDDEELTAETEEATDEDEKQD